MFARCCGCLEMVEMLFGTAFLVCMREQGRALLLISIFSQIDIYVYMKNECWH